MDRLGDIGKIKGMGKKICVFCGSSPGTSPAYAAEAKILAETILEKDFSLVYGGSNAGLMGILASSVMKGGGTVVGVIPKDIAALVEPLEVSELHIVSTMHERKKKMYDFSDAFLAFPGGLGTMDEIFEALTWTQLGIHNKPCGFLNVQGYYDRLMGFLDHAVQEGFVRSFHRNMIQSAPSAKDLLEKLFSFNPVPASKWS